MTEQPGLDDTAPPPGVDLTRPSIARVYDYVLGGKDHYEIDRKASAALFAAVPESRQLAKDNRDGLRRAVTYLVAEAGIRQIIDIGSGLPTAGNVHEIAHAVDPSVHVVYVDIDPIVLAHGRALLVEETSTSVIAGDVRDIEAIFADPEVVRLIDPHQPFAILLVGILHHFADEQDPWAVAAAVRARLTPGSYLLVGNFLDDDEDRAKELERAFVDGGLGTGRFRTWAEQQRFFEGLEMVEPGLEYVNDWRPDHRTITGSPVHTLYATGIGRKP